MENSTERDNTLDRPELVILSTGRAGSGYIAQVLTAAGIPASHEQYWSMYGTTINHRGLPGSPGIVESSWFSLPYVEQNLQYKLVHLVRNPMYTLSSLMNHRNMDIVDRFIQRHCTNWWPWDNVINNYARFIVEWNNRVELLTQYRLKLEDLDAWDIMKIGLYVGRTISRSQAQHALDGISKTYNKHHSGPMLDYGDIKNVDAATSLQQQAMRYGYI